MAGNIDDVVLLLLHCDGKRSAIMTYKEETGASHAEAIWAVEELARTHGLTDTQRTAWRKGMVILAMATFGILCILSMALT